MPHSKKLWRLQDLLDAAATKEEDLLAAATKARNEDAQRAANLRQLHSGRYMVIDLASREARRQEALAQLAAGAATVSLVIQGDRP